MKGATYHVMSRGNRKGAIFEDDADRLRFKKLLGETVNRYRLRCHSYCLMGNHYHVVVETPDGNLSHAMHWLNGGFAQYSNRRHGRTGHLLQGRFKSVLVGDDVYLRTANTYVVLNPVNAGLVADPSEWRWSSYRASAGLETSPDWLDSDWLQWTFGGRTLGDAQRRFREFVLESRGTKSLEGTLAFGSLDLKAEARELIGATLHQVRLPRDYRALARPSLGELFPRRLSKADRNSQVLRAHVVHGYRLAEIAESLFVHPNTISRIVQAAVRTRGDVDKP